VSIDGFHNPPDVRYRRGRGDPEGFFRDSYDYSRFHDLVLEPFARSGRYVEAVYDVHAERAVAARTRVAESGSVLAVDGIFLHRPELLGAWDYSVWLEVPFAISIPRGAQRGYGDPDPGAASNVRYVVGQQLYIAECVPAARATVVVDNSDLAAPTR
jgi:uridine kinase